MSTPESRHRAMWCGDAGRPRSWVVDVANVIGARPDGWWRDRAGAADRLRHRIVGLVGAPPRDFARMLPDRVVLVLEGAARSAAPPQTLVTDAGTVVTVVHAAGSGDDAIVEAAADAPEPVLVISSDRALRGRAHALGAATVGVGALWDLLDRAPGGGNIPRGRP